MSVNTSSIRAWLSNGAIDDAVDLQVTPSTLEVDYDKNLTALYQAITDQDWELAASVSQNDPIQAAIWVVRHYQEDNDENASAAADPGEGDPEIMWRFLPLHSACARQPPVSIIAALLKAYPDAAKCVDDQGMYALHYACGNQAESAVVRLLLREFPRAAAITDPRGMLPLHYMACWGPSSISVITTLLKVNGNAATTRDNDGNTPLDLAMDGDYAEKNAVAEVLRKWIRGNSATKQQQQQHSAAKQQHQQLEEQRQQHSVTKKQQQQHEQHQQQHSAAKQQQQEQQHSAAKLQHQQQQHEHHQQQQSTNAKSQPQSLPLQSKATTMILQTNSHSSHGSGYNDAIVVDTVEGVNIKNTKHQQPLEQQQQPPVLTQQNRGAKATSSNASTNSSSSSSIPVTPSSMPTPRLSNGNNHPQPRQTPSNHPDDEKRSSTTTLVYGSPTKSTAFVETVGSHSTTESLVHDHKSDMHSRDVDTLQRIVKDQETELKITIVELASAKRALYEKTHQMDAVEQELKSTKTLLEESRSVCIGLRATLGDMMEQHETVKKKSGNTTDRLATLSISLDSMMEQQNILTKTVKNRNERYKETFQKRQELFQQLLAMDKAVEVDEGKLDASLKKQTREMEAIAAVIKAARD